MTSYPPHWEADVVVADGGVVHLRPIRPSDADAVLAFHAGLSARTRYLRYFTAYSVISDRDLQRLVNVDYLDRVTLVGLLSDQIIAIGQYDRNPGTDEAEVAFLVADEHQGRGIGSVLLEHLAAAARECGVKRFTAIVLAENQSMINVFRDAGYQTKRHLEAGEVTLQFDIDETAMTEAVMHEREQRAESRSVHRLLFASSVAVVGASNDPGKVGNAVFRNLLRMGFQGPLYPVNPEARHVAGVRAYPTVADVPDPIDLAVIVVPAEAVSSVVAQCADRGVHGLIVISGGFGERGEVAERAAGRAAQAALVSSARAHGMRVVGPNCLGVVNTADAVRLNASLAPLPPLTGRAGFFCQSGALGVAVLGEASRRGLGVSAFVSAGNRADVSANDLLQYWETDDATDIVLLYLESFGNPRKFARLARRLGRRKPIVAVRSGRGPAVGLRHPTMDVPESSVQALFEASGVIRVDTLGELFDVSLLLISQPLPGGDRVAVVGNSTALGVLAIDACMSEQLHPAGAIDIGVDGSPAVFQQAVGNALADDQIDAVVAIFVPPLQDTTGEEHALALRSAAATGGKPVLSTFLGFDGVPGALAEPGPSRPARGSVPAYPSPERAVRALARVVRYAQWRQRPPGTLPQLPGLDPDGARSIIERVLASVPDGRPLEPAETANLLACYQIPVDLSDDSTTTGHLARQGIDVIFGIQDDRSFGALISFGIAGVATELLGDRAYATVPLTTADADRLIDAPRAAPLLSGYKHAPAVDKAALADLALRLSLLADELPDVVHLALHAVAAPRGALIKAASGRVAPPMGRADTGPRRLTGL